MNSRSCQFSPPSSGVGGTTVCAMHDWQHSTLDYDPSADGAEVAWVRAVALEGWSTWHATGVWVVVAEQERTTLGAAPSMRATWSDHDHNETCHGTFDRIRPPVARHDSELPSEAEGQCGLRQSAS